MTDDGQGSPVRPAGTVGAFFTVLLLVLSSGPLYVALAFLVRHPMEMLFTRHPGVMYLFPFSYAGRTAYGNMEYTIDPMLGIFLNVVQWTLIAWCFAPWLGRRRVRAMLPLALLLVVAVGALTALLAWALHIEMATPRLRM